MFENVKPLEPKAHGHLRIPVVTRFDFAAKLHAVPVVGREFNDVAREYVIAFSSVKEGEFLPMAMLGLRRDENLFVNADGKWDAEYIPAFVSRYPFITSELPNDEAVICIDETAAAANQVETSPKMFDGEAPTEEMKKLASTLFMLRDDARAGEQWAKELAAADLFRPVSATANLSTGESVTMDGVWVVDEEKLRALPDEKLAAWVKNGLMSLIYTHIVSLGNLARITRRMEDRIAA